jgi:twitching motility protein PilT
MISFERCLQHREYEGWKPAINRSTGYAEQEVFDYLQKEQLYSAANAAA